MGSIVGQDRISCSAVSIVGLMMVQVPAGVKPSTLLNRSIVAAKLGFALVSAETFLKLAKHSRDMDMECEAEWRA